MCATTVGFSDVGPGEKVDPSCSLCEQLCSSMGCSPAGAQSSWFGWQIISPGLFITEVSLKHPRRDPSRLSKQKLFFFFNSVVQVTWGHGVLFSLESCSDMAVSLLPFGFWLLPIKQSLALRLLSVDASHALMLQLLERGGLGGSGTVELLCLDCLVCVNIQNEHPNPHGYAGMHLPQTSTISSGCISPCWCAYGHL